MSNYILKNARVIDPSSGVDAKGDIFITDGKFASSPAKDAEILDLKGLVAAPGFTDVHVHLRQPGKTSAETIKTGTAAAAHGGFTGVVAMPNTTPCCDTPGTIELIRSCAARDASVRVYPCGALTKNSEGVEMTPIGGLKNAGVFALSDDGKCVQNHDLMRHIMEYAKSFNLPILDHAEDRNMMQDGVMHEGHWSVLLGMKGIPAETESLMVARDAMLAERTGCRIHIQHVSTASSVEILRSSRAKGIVITGEATPHHIALTDACIKKFDSNYKMNPPLCSEEDRMAVINGLCDDTLTVIATDHAPHTATAKAVEFDYAPFGIIGLETAFSVCMTELVAEGYMDLPKLIAKFTTGPAEVLGLPIGTLGVDRAADVVILDPAAKYIVDPSTFHSKSRNTPFGGYHAVGKVMGTMVDGKFVFRDF